MRVAIGVAFFVAASAAAAQTNKCVDAAGKITYASEPCKTLKLKDAGAVEDRLTVSPAPKEKPAKKSAAAKPKAAASDAKIAPAKSREDAQPERRCFQVRLADGKTATRCNDGPGEPNPVPTDEKTKAERTAE